MSLGLRKLGLLAVLAGLLMVLGVWRPGAPASDTEASLATPGGITAMPTGGVGIPGMANQAAPAVIRARPPGNYAVVTVFCDPLAQAPAFPAFGGTFPLHCPNAGMPFDPTDPIGLGSGAITFEISQLYPGGDAASTFAATGTQTLVCDDNAGCDLSATRRPALGAVLDVGVVAVQVNGGGVNEIIEVRATDEIGESLSVQIVVVDTIMVFGATGPVGTASQEQPMLVAYACDDIGRQPAAAEAEVEHPRPVADPNGNPNESADADLDGVVGLDDVWDLLYGWGSAFAFAQLDNNFARDVDLPLSWCGGDTASPLDDLVTFEIDKGLLSIDPFAQSVTASGGDAATFTILIPAFFDIDCDEGQSVSARDADALGTWAYAMQMTSPPEGSALFTDPPPLEGECDVDFAPNGVVTYGILGTGEVGTFTVKAQQGGGVSPPRTANGVFIGEPRISLFLDAPAVVGPEGAVFGVFVVDEGFRPAAGVTVECTVDPPNAALMVVPAGGTTGSFVSATPGQTNMTLVPTGQSVVDGETLTLTCVADRDRSVIGVAVMTLSSTPVMEALDLVAGCNPIVSTWADGTDIATVAGAVAPAEALDAIWAYDPVAPAWMGYAPAAPEASDLASTDQLGALFVCANAAATLTRPVI